MSKQKIKVAIVFGGRSAEHEISLLSARNVVQSLDTEKFEPVLIGIDKEGQWHYNADSMKILNADDPGKISLSAESNPVLISQNTDSKAVISLTSGNTIASIDVIFPVLHGSYGEDGSIQGFAQLANIPCVGCGILGSAVGMDKDIMKRILRDSAIGVAPWLLFRRSDNAPLSYDHVSKSLGNEVFIKPANLGSSVGITFARSKSEFDNGLQYAFQYDTKVIVEAKVIGREVECAVLGNEHPKASIPGEIISQKGWYSYESKYLDETGAILEIPAKLNDKQAEMVRQTALKTYRVLECSGMARVDMFLKPDDTIIVNEINTIPGFTNISMYPKLWEYTGIPQKVLITQLIELAMESHQTRNKLKTK